jgi:hypothetical protein
MLFRAKSILLYVSALLAVSSAGFAEAIVADHNAAADFNNIPSYWIERAKDDLHIAYQHTSHGSQLVTGLNALKMARAVWIWTIMAYRAVPI